MESACSRFGVFCGLMERVFFGRARSLLLPAGFSPGMASRGFSLDGAHRHLTGQSTGSRVRAQ